MFYRNFSKSKVAGLTAKLAIGARVFVYMRLRSACEVCSYRYHFLPAASEGDKFCQDVFHRAGRHLGRMAYTLLFPREFHPVTTPSADSVASPDTGHAVPAHVHFQSGSGEDTCSLSARCVRMCAEPPCASFTQMCTRTRHPCRLPRLGRLFGVCALVLCGNRSLSCAGASLRPYLARHPPRPLLPRSLTPPLGRQVNANSPPSKNLCPHSVFTVSPQLWISTYNSCNWR